MDMGNSTGIGFKVFGLFALIIGAICIDIIIFSGGIDFEGFTDSLEDIFYTDYYEEEEWYLDCDYTFTYLDNENYKLWNKSNLDGMVYKISALWGELYNYSGTFPEEPSDIVYTYKLEYCDTTIQFNDKMDYLRFEDSNGIAIYEGSNYTDYLKEIKDTGILTDSLVHFYEDEYFENETEFYDKELSYEDANRVSELWYQNKNNVVEWSFETDADYMLVIGNDFIIFDNFGGRVFYNGHHVEVPKEMMDILWKYI